MEDRKKKKLSQETALLVGLIQPDDEEHHEPQLTELGRLVKTAGAIPLDTVVQKRRRPHPATFIGKGKAREIGELADALAADLIIFDHDLSPAQLRNLEKILERRVIDRSELILDIFATRARSRQARVQVELAQLEYLRPRLRRMWTHLSRIEGGIGMRGPGEKQIELDRRMVRRRIQALRDELRTIERQQKTRSAARRGYFSVSLLGYTNAGKSTLLRTLTGAETLIEDKLFATLDTMTRAWRLPGGKRVFLSDTVGFIRGLPHHLVASFHATLDEAREADLLLHVVDASNPDADLQMGTVRRVLKELGGVDVPMITVLNKVDQVEEPLSLELLRPKSGTTVSISAMTGEGIPDLEFEVGQVVDTAQVEVELLAHAGDGRLLAYLAAKGSIISQEYEGEDEMRVVARLPRRFAATIPGHEVKPSGEEEPV